MFTPDYTKGFEDNYRAWFNELEKTVGLGVENELDDNKALAFCAHSLLHPWTIHDYVFGGKAPISEDYRNLDALLSQHLKGLLDDIQKRAGWSFDLCTRFTCCRTRKIIDELISVTDPDIGLEQETPHGFIGLDIEAMSILEEYRELYLQVGRNNYATYMTGVGQGCSEQELYFWQPLILTSLLEEYRQWKGDGSIGTNRHHLASFLRSRFNRMEMTFLATSEDFIDNKIEFTLDTLPPWLTNRSDSTMDMSWFVDCHIATLDVGETVKTDYHIIERIK